MDLVIFDQLKRDLEQSFSIEEVKDIRDKAESLRQYAKMAGESLIFQNYCAELKIRAERKAGELLGNTVFTKGGDRKSEDFKNQRLHDETVDSVNLSDFGISKIQSFRWKLIASLDEDEFEKHLGLIKSKNKELTSREFLVLASHKLKEIRRFERQSESISNASLVPLDDRIKVLQGDFREVLNQDIVPDDSVDLIMTDPMYTLEFLPLWADLAQFASRVLKPGHLLVAYAGYFHLPRIIDSLEAHLNYIWLASVQYQRRNAVFPVKINSCFKPVLIFSKGKYQPGPDVDWLDDSFQGDPYMDVKTESELQQGVGEFSYFIDCLTNPGDLVVDPFLGYGTCGIACKRTGRRFIGSEILEDRFKLAASKIALE